MAIVWKELGSEVTPSNNIAIGTFEANVETNSTTVELGFKPKQLAIYNRADNPTFISIYNEEVSATEKVVAYENTASEMLVQSRNALSNKYEGCLCDITETGFTVRNITTTSNKTMYYFAIG